MSPCLVPRHGVLPMFPQLKVVSDPHPQNSRTHLVRGSASPLPLRPRSSPRHTIGSIGHLLPFPGFPTSQIPSAGVILRGSSDRIRQAWDTKWGAPAPKAKCAGSLRRRYAGAVVGSWNELSKKRGGLARLFLVLRPKGSIRELYGPSGLWRRLSRRHLPGFGIEKCDLGGAMQLKKARC
jgi:hypothetical protein